MPSTSPSDASEVLLQRAVARSQRPRSVPLHIHFLQGDGKGRKSPLSVALRGGRGGEVRIKLYLSVILMATSPPYNIRRPIPARVWAEMLGLPDPAVNGARRIADALNWLDKHQLIALERRKGAPPAIWLLDPKCDGSKYARPTVRWVPVPLALWEKQWITTLSGGGLALLLVLLDLQGGKKTSADAPWVTKEQREKFGLSDDTWTRATAELKSYGLLEVHRIPQSQDLDWLRLRNTYWIDKDALSDHPPAAQKGP
jgi:hypothetical protein